MTAVLFVRVPPNLIKLLDRELASRRKREPARVISRADVVRTILLERLGGDR